MTRAFGVDSAEEDRLRAERRALLGIAIVSPLLLLGGGSASAQDAPCVDVSALPSSQKNLRRTLGYKLVSPDPKKRCASCAFFTATAGSCGKCAMFSGGAVAATNVCDSWSAKG